MKNLFEIDSSEIKRILNLHEERTKTQYLDIVSEQEKQYKVPSYTTSTQLLFSSEYDDPYTIPNGVNAKFLATNDSNVVTAKNVKVTRRDVSGGYTYETKNISFYCNRGKFYFSGNKNEYYQETLGPSLVKNVCGRLSSKTTKAKVGTVYNQMNDAVFIGENGLEVFALGKGTQWKWDGTYGKIAGGPGVIKSSNVNKSFGNVFFMCSPKGDFYFILGSDRFKDKTYGLTSSLKKTFCQVVVKPQKISKPTTSTTSTSTTSGTTQQSTTQQGTTQQGGGAKVQRKRVDITPSIRNVQKSIGVAETGSFDTETLNKIIQQL